MEAIYQRIAEDAKKQLEEMPTLEEALAKVNAIPRDQRLYLGDAVSAQFTNYDKKKRVPNTIHSLGDVEVPMDALNHLMDKRCVVVREKSGKFVLCPRHETGGAFVGGPGEMSNERVMHKLQSAIALFQCQEVCTGKEARKAFVRWASIVIEYTGPAIYTFKDATECLTWMLDEFRGEAVHTAKFYGNK